VLHPLENHGDADVLVLPAKEQFSARLSFRVTHGDHFVLDGESDERGASFEAVVSGIVCSPSAFPSPS
jgi:hypothetical protein